MATTKLASDADWADANVEACVTTKGGHQILWQCWISNMHDTASWVDFMTYETLRLEAALYDMQRTVVLTLNDDEWSIDLKEMTQTNVKTQTARPIRRVVVLKTGVLKD